MQALQRVIDAAGSLYVASDGGTAEFGHLARCDVGGHRNHAVAAAQHESHGGSVVAGIKGEILRRTLDQVAAAGQVGSGVLDADDVGDFGQAQHGVVTHVGHSAARHVVKDDRDVGRFGNGTEVPVHAFLHRLVVVRHDRQHLVGPEAAGFARQFDGFVGRVGAGAGDDLDAAGCVPDH